MRCRECSGIGRACTGEREKIEHCLQQGSVCPEGEETEGTGRVGICVRIVGGKVVQEGWRAPLSVLLLWFKVKKC